MRGTWERCVTRAIRGWIRSGSATIADETVAAISPTRRRLAAKLDDHRHGDVVMIEARVQLYSLGDLVALSRIDPRPLRAVYLDARGERELHLADGEVLHARFGDLRGVEAVYAMLDEPARTFVLERDAALPERTVRTPWRRLCHEARCALLDAPASLGR
jgi:hypothetical protein